MQNIYAVLVFLIGIAFNDCAYGGVVITAVNRFVDTRVSLQVGSEITSEDPIVFSSQTEGTFSATQFAHVSPAGRDGEAQASQTSEIATSLAAELFVSGMGSAAFDFDRLDGSETGVAVAESNLQVNFEIDSPMQFAFDGELFSPIEGSGHSGSVWARLFRSGGPTIFQFTTEGQSPGTLTATNTGMLDPGPYAFYAFSHAGGSFAGHTASFDVTFSVTAINTPVPEPASLVGWSMLTAISIGTYRVRRRGGPTGAPESLTRLRTA
jgi:hypothetical protein